MEPILLLGPELSPSKKELNFFFTEPFRVQLFLWPFVSSSMEGDPRLSSVLREVVEALLGRESPQVDTSDAEVLLISLPGERLTTELSIILLC